MNAWHAKQAMEVKERILRKTEMEEETFCWRWAGSMSGRKRYGKITAGGRSRLAHRVAYEEFRDGEEIVGKEIHHRCLNKLCCNPWHMKAVTRVEHVEEQGGWGRPRISMEEKRERARERRRVYRLRWPEKWRERVRRQNAGAKARDPKKIRGYKKAQKLRMRARDPEKWRAQRRAQKARYRERGKIQKILGSFGEAGWEKKAGRLLAA